MRGYADIDGDSSVVGYEIGDEFITVWFDRAPKPYTYSYARAGQAHVERMKQLARMGDGLNAYINQYVRYKYDR